MTIILITMHVCVWHVKLVVCEWKSIGWRLSWLWLSNEEIRAERKDQRLYISFASIVHKYKLGLFISDLETRDLRIVFFFVRIESRIESAVRFVFESNLRIDSALYTTQAVTQSDWLQAYRTGLQYNMLTTIALWTNESDVRNCVFVHFNSVLKRVKQCRCTLI